MSLKSRIATFAIAALAVTGVATTSASAKHKINPVAAGLFGAAVVGTTIAAATTPSYAVYPRQRRCFLEPQYNVFGQFVGYAKLCRWH